MCDGAYLSEEYTYDAEILKNYFIRRLSESEKVEIKYGIYIENVSKLENHYQLELNDGNVLETDFVLNATYASTNQISRLFGF